VSPLAYALSQSGVILHYVRLVFWPVGQCADYGRPVARTWPEYLPQTCIVLSALGATIFGLARGRLWSFPAAAFFLLLAPTSSIVPIVDLAFEHRMYLPSAAIILAAVCGAKIAFEAARNRLGPELPGTAESSAFARFAFPCLVAVAVCVLGTATLLRNRVYASQAAFWTDVIAKAPHHSRGYSGLGAVLSAEGKNAEAWALYGKALERNPRDLIALTALAEAAAEDGRFDEAEELLGRAASVNPRHGDVLLGYGILRAAQGRADDAARYFATAIELNPYDGVAMNHLGLLLVESNRDAEAADLFIQAAELRPRDPAPRSNLAVVFCRQNRFAEAVPWFQRALECDPAHAQSRANLAKALEHLGS
jgi:tetratricopeptide (TPR) repeat protein